MIQQIDSFANLQGISADSCKLRQKWYRVYYDFTLCQTSTSVFHRWDTASAGQ
jgi:hypothetical protein